MWRQWMGRRFCGPADEVMTGGGGAASMEDVAGFFNGHEAEVIAPGALPAGDEPEEQEEPAEPGAGELGGKGEENGTAADDDAPLPFALDGDETPEDPEGEAKPDANAEWPEAARARIAELESQAADLETVRAELETVKSQLAGKTQAILPSSPDLPLADITTGEQLEQREADAKRVWDWANSHPNGGLVTMKDGTEVEKSAEEMAQIKAAAERTWKVEIPQRREWLIQHGQALKATAEKYPALMKNGPASDEAFRILDTLPAEFRKDPNWPLYVGDMMVGRAMRRGEIVIARASKGEGVRKKAEGDAKKTPGTPPSSARPPGTNGVKPGAGKERAAQEAVRQFTDPKGMHGVEELAGTLTAMGY